MTEGVTFEIFRMPDDEEAFYEDYPFLKQYRTAVEQRFRASSRRKEILSEKVLIEKLFPGKNVSLLHNDNGMPLLSNGMNVSISHTKNYIAMMVSEHYNVALDIEHISDRVQKVGKMYLREDEHFKEINEMLVAWCVKETMYKLYSSSKLSFDEIYIKPFTVSSEGVVYADNMRTEETVKLHFTVTPEYVLTTTSVLPE